VCAKGWRRPRLSGDSGDKSGDAAEEVRSFVRACSVLDPRVWSYRAELWRAYSVWAGADRLCRSRDELEAPLLAARVVAIGMSGNIIAGVGLRAHWPREAAEQDARRAGR
jgi:hypothetical protein